MADDFISGALAGQQFQMNKMLLQEAPVKLEQEKLALKISQQTYDQRQKMAELLAADPSKVPEGQDPMLNASNALLRMGSAAAKSGLVEESSKFFKEASSIQTQQEDAAYKKWQQTFQQTKFADSLLATVTDQASLDQANSYVRMSTGKPSALEGHKYSPELIEALKKSSEAKRTEAQEALTKAQERKANVETEAAKELVPLRKSQIALNEAKTAAAKKVGGDGLIAKPANITAVANEIRKVIGNDNISSSDARTFANDIALDAEDRMGKEHLTRDQAVNAAVRYAKDHGVLAGIAPARTRPGQSWAKPLPLDITGPHKDNLIYTPSTTLRSKDGSVWPAGEARRYNEETNQFYKRDEGPEDDVEEDEE
jgi:hypothetical protein